MQEIGKNCNFIFKKKKFGPDPCFYFFFQAIYFVFFNKRKSLLPVSNVYKVFKAGSGSALKKQLDIIQICIEKNCRIRIRRKLMRIHLSLTCILS